MFERGRERQRCVGWAVVGGWVSMEVVQWLHDSAVVGISDAVLELWLAEHISLRSVMELPGGLRIARWVDLVPALQSHSGPLVR